MSNARLVTASILLFVIGAVIGFRFATSMFLFLLGPVLSQHWLANSLVDMMAFTLRTALLVGFHFASPAIALLICPRGVRRTGLAIAFVGLSAFLAAVVAAAYVSEYRSVEALISQGGVTVVSELRAAPFIPIFLSGPLLIFGIAAILRLRNRPL